MTYSAKIEGRSALPVPEPIVALILKEVTEHEIPFRQREGGISIEVENGRVDADFGADGFRVIIAASAVARAHEMREALLHVLEHASPDFLGAIKWSGDLPQGDVPPNVRFATVVQVERLSPNFQRVTLSCERVREFTEGGMHFRLLMPKPDRKPVWPYLDENQRTVWASGEDALHNPAFTFATIDVEVGTFTFDVYEHEGGQTTQWARAASRGDLIGLVGPGGGGLPQGDKIVLAGDETALPAIRRILENSSSDRTGQVFLETGDDADRLPLTHPSGVSVEWLDRSSNLLLDRILSAPLPGPEESRFVWIAGERELARKARKHMREQGFSPRDSYVSAYWTS